MEIKEEPTEQKQASTISTPPKPESLKPTTNSRLMDMIGRFTQEPKSDSRLTFDQELDLIQKVRVGNPRALRQLIKEYKGFIVTASQRYDRSIDRQALVCSGEAAVDIAAKKYDESKGHRFITYFSWVLRTEIQKRYCSEAGISREVSRNVSAVNEAAAFLTNALGREPSVEEIAEQSNLTVQTVLNALMAKNFTQSLSLSGLIDEDSTIQYESALVDHSCDPWAYALSTEQADILQALEESGRLESKHVDAVTSRIEGYSAKEIGERHGVGPERVRQFIKKAKSTVHEFLAGDTSVETPEVLAIPEVVVRRVFPILPRVDAVRLGGRIGRAIQAVVTPVQSMVDALVDCPLLKQSETGINRPGLGLDLETVFEGRSADMPTSDPTKEERILSSLPGFSGVLPFAFGFLKGAVHYATGLFHVLRRDSVRGPTTKEGRIRSSQPSKKLDRYSTYVQNNIIDFRPSGINRITRTSEPCLFGDRRGL